MKANSTPDLNDLSTADLEALLAHIREIFPNEEVIKWRDRCREAVPLLENIESYYYTNERGARCFDGVKAVEDGLMDFVRSLTINSEYGLVDAKFSTPAEALEGAGVMQKLLDSRAEDERANG